MVYGHVGGALIGFGAGLLADLAPPADHAAGRYALVLCVIGYVAGLASPDNGQLVRLGPMAVVVAAAVGSTLLYAGVGALVGDTAARHVGLGSLLFTAALYDLLLAPFVVPRLMALARRAENDPLPSRPARPAKAADVSSGWLASGTGLRIGSQRGGLRQARARPRGGASRGSSAVAAIITRGVQGGHRSAVIFVCVVHDAERGRQQQ